MKDMKRALRRHHVARAKEKVRRIVLEVWRASWRHHYDEATVHKHVERKVQRMHKNRKPCSCAGCGNQRHSVFASGTERLSMQERRSNSVLQDMECFGDVGVVIGEISD
jgi:hypothetical protein